MAFTGSTTRVKLSGRGTAGGVLFDVEDDAARATDIADPGSIALDVRDDGTVVGQYGGDPDSFLYKNGAVTRIDLSSARAINDGGQVAGDGWIRDADGSVLDLKEYSDQHLGVSSLHNSGAVVGTADVDPDPFITNYRGFRTMPGEPFDASRDLLPYSGLASEATDINNKWQIAGYGKNSAGGYVPLIWDENNVVHEQETLNGGKALAINNAGIAVGERYTVSGGLGYQRAAMFVGGESIDLNTLKPAGTTLTLRKATGINDFGQIAGIAQDGIKYHAFLLDLGTHQPVINSVTIETKRYPSEDWGKAEAVTDGAPARIVLSVTNPGSQSITAQIKLSQAPNPGDGVPGMPLPVEPIEVQIDPNDTVNVRRTWDTAGVAWEKGEANLARYVKARAYVGGVKQTYAESESIRTRPKPVVLVHGWKTDAEASWGYTHAILNSLHPLFSDRSFAVGDGQFGPDGGTLNTGTLTDPLKRTNTLEENAEELAKYLENVRKRTGAWHVDLIGHSMGGNIARQYIQDEMPSSPDGKPVVNRLLQMGAPNEGTPCAEMLVLTAMLNHVPVPYSPATEQNTTVLMQDFNKHYMNLKGVTLSNLVGVGRRVPCGVPFPKGDLIVPAESARSVYTDTPVTGTVHMSMTDSAWDFQTYVKDRLSSVPGKAGDPGLPGLTKGVTATAPATEDDGADAGSTFAASSTAVQPGQTVTVPLDVPQGTAFGVTGALPPTVGLLLRNPSGEPAAQYAAGSDEAKQPVQGLGVDNPQAGAWKLEITNTAAEPVTADLGAWVAGNPVKVAAKAEQPSEDGRVKMTGTVTDGGQPVTGVPVRAIVIGEDGARAELALKDDGNSGDGAVDDGVYGATSEPLADGVYSITVKADTAKGMRSALEVVEVKQVDTREFALTLSAGPGGSVAASPAQEVYRAGTKVTLTATPEAGRVPIGWTVDGQKRGAGALTLMMDGPHTVEARFGTYSVTEIGALPGGDASNTNAETLNDRGQVAATVTKNGKKHAVRWQDGNFTDLGGRRHGHQRGRGCVRLGCGVGERQQLPARRYLAQRRVGHRSAAGQQRVGHAEPRRRVERQRSGVR
ncbi:choice-of-anchor X domain-containing protein [Streptosporangium canum]|uniref:choice-of-anchor X domain-containing protein n=1 Tax=Streptosporangium canum TaxID=324952 RepID=UPI00342CA8AA